MRPARCELCAAVLGDADNAHLLHDEDCPRPSHDVECNSFLGERCECRCVCDRWGCAGCCPDSACVTPLAAQVRAAHDATVAALEDAS